LPIGRTALRAWRLVWQSRDEILRIGAVPLLLSLALSLTVRVLPRNGVVVTALVLEWVPLSLFAVAWLRLLLCPSDAGSRGLTTRWTKRETRFTIRILAINLGTNIAAGIVVGMTALALGLRLDRDAAVFMTLVAAGAGLAIYLMLRLSLVLPAAAIDLAYGYRDSWRDTAGFGFRLLLIVVLTDAPVGLALLLLHGTWLTQALPYTMILVTDIISYLVFAASMAVLAVAFGARPSAGSAVPVER
jgi:hypothetical protein